MQHSQRAIPFGKNGKPSKQNSLTTVAYNFTLKRTKAKQPLAKHPKGLIGASYDPLTGMLTETRTNDTGTSYKQSRRFLPLWEECS